MSTIILYHGTDEVTLDAIQSGAGLLPRCETGRGNWDRHPSNSGCIYLTNSYAGYFAAMASAESDTRPVVLSVAVETDQLLPDEDFLEQATREGTRPGGAPRDMARATAHYRETLRDYADAWRLSLDHLGTVAHDGEILRSRIHDVVVFDDASDVIIECDPTITLINQKLLGEQYRRYSKELFSDLTKHAPRRRVRIIDELEATA